MFFGLGWALTSIMALNYFQSMIIPQSAEGWLYFLTTYIGQYGVILSLSYFFIYAPVVSLFPSYYVSRIWSIALILFINLFIFFDSYLFVRYRFHLNSFLWNLLKENEALNAFGLTSFKLTLISVVAFIFAAILWIRGERLWRSMQARFSNPVSNWYLVVIAICFVTSQLLYMYGDAKGTRSITRLTTIFPFQYNLNGKELLKGQVTQEKAPEVAQTYKDFSYPLQELSCSTKKTKNVILVVLDKWNEADFNQESMPNLFHYSTHGLLYKNHYSGGLDKQDGYFSLLYSLPPTYSQSAMNQSTEPVFLSLIKKAKMDVSFLQYGSTSPVTDFRPEEKEISIDYIESQLPEKKEDSEPNPFFMQFYVESASVAEKDKTAKAIFDVLIKRRILNDTIVVVTGAYSEGSRTPMFMIWPGKGREEISKLTSHYDIMPTIIQEEWKCKNPVSDYSLGHNLFDQREHDLVVTGNYRLLKIVNIKDQTLTSLDQYNGFEVKDLVTGEVKNDKKNNSAVLQMLQKLTAFYQR